MGWGSCSGGKSPIAHEITNDWLTDDVSDEAIKRNCRLLTKHFIAHSPNVMLYRAYSLPFYTRQKSNEKDFNSFSDGLQFWIKQKRNDLITLGRVEFAVKHFHLPTN